MKLSRLEGGGIGPRTESCVKWSGPYTMVVCLHQGYIYAKRKLWVRRDKKCLPLVGAKAELTCVGRETTQSRLMQYSAKTGKLRKMGWTDCHVTVFAPRQYLYQNEAIGMEGP